MSRALTIIILLGTLIHAVGCQQSPGGAGIGEVVQVGTTKPSLFGVPEEYRTLHVDLEKCFDAPVSFSAQPDGAALGTQLEQGNIPYAILTAKEFAEISNPRTVTPLATAINGMGRPSRKAHIVVKAKSHLKTIKDCGGKRFAFGKYKDLLTDYAARAALQSAGIPLDKLLPELLPPPFAMEGRLYVQNDVPAKIVLDLTVNAGVVDEVVFANLPKSGGNPITGPSQDQFEIVGETLEIPETVVVAGPAADPQQSARLKAFLLNEAKSNAQLCKQMGIQGFAEPDAGAYEAVKKLLPKSR